MKPNRPIEMPVNVSRFILDAMNNRHMSIAQLSKALGMGNSSVHYLLKGRSVQVGRLWTICEATGINIFRQLADEIGIENPVDPEIVRLKQELEDLKKEREILRDVIALNKK